MAIINVYNDETNETYQVFAYIRSTPATPQTHYFLEISTNIRKTDGSEFPVFVVNSLEDVDPDSTSPADNWTELIKGYVDYFVSEAQLGMSSSSSSSSSSSNSSSSSSPA